MDNINTTIFAKKENGKTRFWMSVNTKKDDSFVTASQTVYLSEKAKDEFLSYMEPTKNDEIRKLAVTITDGWFKAVQGKEKTFVVFFVNSMSKTEKKESKGSW